MAGVALRCEVSVFVLHRDDVGDRQVRIQQLCRWNTLTRDAEIHEGDTLYIAEPARMAQVRKPKSATRKITCVVPHCHFSQGVLIG